MMQHQFSIFNVDSFEADEEFRVKHCAGDY